MFSIIPMVAQRKCLQKIHKRQFKRNQSMSLQKILKTKEGIIEEKRGKITTLLSSQKTINKVAMVSPYLSLITLSRTRLKSPIKRFRMIEWIKYKTQLYAINKRFT